MEPHIPFFLSNAGTATGSTAAHLEFQRAQFQEYAQRLQMGIRTFPGHFQGINSLAYQGHLINPYFHPYMCKDPRTRYLQEEPKPNHSYIGLIAMAILSARDQKLVLSDIYQWILDNYSYFRTRGPGWRNSIRHNLSLNDCFVKAGRSANGKGHYWAIHPANIEDFQKGDFRRRRAQRRVRRHMGLSVADDDDDDSPAPSPVPPPQPGSAVWTSAEEVPSGFTGDLSKEQTHHHLSTESLIEAENGALDLVSPIRKARRQFDMDSLLAPDPQRKIESNIVYFPPGHFHKLPLFPTAMDLHLSKQSAPTFKAEYPREIKQENGAKDENDVNNENYTIRSDTDDLNDSKHQQTADENEIAKYRIEDDEIDVSTSSQGSPSEKRSMNNKSPSDEKYNGSENGDSVDHSSIESDRGKEVDKKCNGGHETSHPKRGSDSSSDNYGVISTTSCSAVSSLPIAFDSSLYGNIGGLSSIALHGFNGDFQRLGGLDLVRHRLTFPALQRHPIYARASVPAIRFDHDAIAKWQQSMSASFVLKNVHKGSHVVL
ncbi:uncharacterized protein LOC127878409 [Dreissena polymorpha]|uniref:Fork-head domain-containing protein n=1 Tax=Dreissena polymorpha TaxID=45954 RepID=A0A9D4QK98_DREPO|nr:uncharacterized protein LOC127878409 [Dreissena polymorpha]KAH3834224.1 hypothetical protein DPMN_107544 [Dreissena polymorpha]